VSYEFCSKFNRFQQCKIFENRLRFGKVTDSLKVGSVYNGILMQSHYVMTWYPISGVCRLHSRSRRDSIYSLLCVMREMSSYNLNLVGLWLSCMTILYPAAPFGTFVIWWHHKSNRINRNQITCFQIKSFVLK